MLPPPPGLTTETTLVEQSRRVAQPRRVNGDGSNVGLVFTAPCPGPPSVTVTTGAPGIISLIG